MVVEIVIYSLMIISLSWMLIDYFKSRNFILQAKNPLYPRCTIDGKTVRTVMAPVEELSFQTRSWKVKKWTVFTVTILIIAVIFITIYFERYSWHSALIFIHLPLMTKFTSKVPCFVILPIGVYIEERLFKWENIKGYTTSSIKIGDEAYGMFDDSPSYTEIKLHGNRKTKSIYVQDRKEIDKIISVLNNNGVYEVNNSKVAHQ
ncbi:hypothetical protein ACERII_00345 [Evansella sp. AB-rgal1]|uniref:hypothetical protein n=1 Tax=Evansella sp. AB-rgal1 TaxID=3242696 RepID=UPI00359ED2B5